MHACLISSLSHVQLFAALWTVARQAPLSMGFSTQEYWRGLPCSPPEDLPDPGSEPSSSVSPALQEDYLPLSRWGSSAFCGSFYQVFHTHNHVVYE